MNAGKSPIIQPQLSHRWRFVCARQTRCAKPGEIPGGCPTGPARTKHEIESGLRHPVPNRRDAERSLPVDSYYQSFEFLYRIVKLLAQ